MSNNPDPQVIFGTAPAITKRPMLKETSDDNKTRIPEHIFLNKAKRQIFPEFNSDSQEINFLLRYHPSYKDQKFLVIANEINGLLNDGFSLNNINGTNSQVSKKMDIQFANDICKSFKTLTDKSLKKVKEDLEKLDSRFVNRLEKLVQELKEEDGISTVKREHPIFANVFCEAMRKSDDVSLQDWLNYVFGLLECSLPKQTQQGRPQKSKSPWRLRSKFLWEIKFYCWLWDWLWTDFIDKANTVDNWLQEFPKQSLDNKKTSQTRNIEGTDKEDRESRIQSKTEYELFVNLKNSESRYLLLLNQGTSGEIFCICPSSFFAPNTVLYEGGMCLPQSDAEKTFIKFSETGKEQFIAIVMDEPLNWKFLSSDVKVPVLNAKHLKELWELQQQLPWKLYYKSFDVT